MEASTGIEPVYTDLQSAASPLRQLAEGFECNSRKFGGCKGMLCVHVRLLTAKNYGMTGVVKFGPMSTAMIDFATRRTVMVDTQIRPSDVTKFPVIDAMLSVAREAYLPDEKRDAAYVEENIAIADGRVVLEPRTFAKMLDALDIQSDELILEIGCGYGYSTAVLAHMAGAVVAVEDTAEMVAEAQHIMSDNNADNAAVVEAALSEGAAKHGPYDVIVIEGGVEEIPEALLGQLAEGGRIAAIFMNGSLGTVQIGYNIDGQVNWRFAFNAAAPVLPGFEAAPEFTL